MVGPVKGLFGVRDVMSATEPTLSALQGDVVTLCCNTYEYSGRLMCVTGNDAQLEDVVISTTHTRPGYAQTITVCQVPTRVVRISAIESYGLDHTHVESAKRPEA